jgi:hypothetical protein
VKALKDDFQGRRGRRSRHRASVPPLCASAIPPDAGRPRSDRWNSRLQQLPTSRDCKLDCVRGLPVDLGRHAPVKRLATCRIVQSAHQVKGKGLGLAGHGQKFWQADRGGASTARGCRGQGQPSWARRLGAKGHARGWLSVFFGLCQCIDSSSTPAAAISSNTCCERGPRRCLHLDARIQEQRDAKSRHQQPRRVSPEMASKPRDMCHGALLSQCPPLDLVEALQFASEIRLQFLSVGFSHPCCCQSAAKTRWLFFPAAHAGRHGRSTMCRSTSRLGRW